MISRLKGKILEKNPPCLVVDVYGIGFEIETSLHTFCQLPNVFEEVSLYVQCYYREDSQQLFGFYDKREKEFFNQLLKVSGVGVKMALAILSVLDTEELSLVIETKNLSQLVLVPGVGKKTAERLILELTGKLQLKEGVKGIEIGNQKTTGQVIKALLALGYQNKEAQQAVQELPAQLNLSEAVKWALKKLAR
ncbi:MAG: Holliday junction branch migration protein RuvA [Neisseriaceae bacterium]